MAVRAPDSLKTLPRTIPIFPLGGALLLPRGRLPLNVFEPRYLQMVDDTLASHRLIGMIQPVESTMNAPRPALHKVGCIGRITQFSESGDGRYLITLSGIGRFDVVSELDCVTPYRQVQASFERFEGDLFPAEDGDAIDRGRLLDRLRQYLKLHRLEADWDAIDRAGGEALVNSLCMISPFGISEKQALLEAPTTVERTDVLIALIEMAMAGGSRGSDTPIQ